MAVRMLQSMAGTAESWAPGDLYEGSEEEEARLVEAGLAEPAEEPSVQPQRTTARRK